VVVAAGNSGEGGLSTFGSPAVSSGAIAAASVDSLRRPATVVN